MKFRNDVKIRTDATRRRILWQNQFNIIRKQEQPLKRQLSATKTKWKTSVTSLVRVKRYLDERTTRERRSRGTQWEEWRATTSLPTEISGNVESPSSLIAPNRGETHQNSNPLSPKNIAPFCRRWRLQSSGSRFELGDSKREWILFRSLIF